jgi:hypothetical protein
MLYNQMQLLATAEAHQRERDQNVLATHLLALPDDPVDIQVGSYVLMDYPKLASGRHIPKLRTPRKGPFLVVDRVDANTLGIEDLVSARHYEVNLFVPYVFHPFFEPPVAVARREQEEWTVDFIIEHRPVEQRPTSRKALSFLVRWAGQSPHFDRWLPWNALRFNDRLHDRFTAVDSTGIPRTVGSSKSRPSPRSTSRGSAACITFTVTHIRVYKAVSD